LVPGTDRGDYLDRNELTLPSHLRGLESARPTLDYAREYTKRITFGHYENFPVASRLVPKHLRQHVCNIYAFARTADDFADEASYDDVRMEYLDEWEEELNLAFHYKSIHPIFVALEETIRNFALPEKLFVDLIKAFKMDVVKDRYRNFDEILYYCRHSANPVGRLILLLYGYNNEEWFKWSDNICTALQLANFWQDVSVDLKKKRIYLPQEEMVQQGVTEYDLEEGRFTKELQSLIEAQVRRTEELFFKGKPLCKAIPNLKLSYELRLTWLGGMTILQKIKANDYNIFKRPVVTKLNWARLLLKSFIGF
jgi:squalene synthase HpnC